MEEKRMLASVLQGFVTMVSAEIRGQLSYEKKDIGL